MKRPKRFYAGLLFFSLLPCMVAFGQTTSRVTGVIKDSSGALVPEAQVALTEDATGVSFTTRSTSSGTYVFDAVKPGVYSLKVNAKGFKTAIYTRNIVTIGQPTEVNVTMNVGTINEMVEVTGAAELVQTATSGNIGNLVDNAALNSLPIVTTRGRNTLSLVELEPGVVDSGGFNQGGPNVAGGGVHVNGSRDRAWNYTLDGIDINETSAGGSNFSPLRTNPDMLAEFRVVTSNFTSEYGRNSGAQVEMVTKSGTNNYHGSAYFFYQTPGFNANDPANKEQGLSRPQFLQFIPGFTLGGPVIRNKTFFFVNFQWLRTTLTTLNSNTVYTDQARNGILRFIDQGSAICQPADFQGLCFNTPAGSSSSTVDNNGQPRPGVTIDSYDVAAKDPQGLGLDPSVQAVLKSMPSPNNFSTGDGLNVAAFNWLASEHEKQLDYTVRLDHTFNSRHSAFVRWSAGHQNTLGDTANLGLPIFPGFPNVVDTFRTPKNLAVAWRWVVSPRILNELVVGMNRFGFNFANPDTNSQSNPVFNFLANPLCVNGVSSCMQVPLQNYVGNARFLTGYQLADNMTYLKGSHAFKWGINFRYQRHIDQRGSIGALNAALAINFDPTVNVPDPAAYQYDQAHLNIDQENDLPNAAGFINDLLGQIGSIQQGFVAKDPNTWAPAGTLLHADFRMPEYDFYGQDSWRIRPNLVLDLGLRWEIKLSPRVTNASNMLRPNPPLGWGNGSDSLTWVPGQLYKDSYRNLGPSIGFAWDPHGNGKTSVRGNFRVAYDRINTFSLSSAVFQGMPGLTAQVTDQAFGGGGGRLSALTPAELNAIFDSYIGGSNTPTSLRQPPHFGQNSITVVDPNWRPPQTYMWSLGIQRELPQKFVLELNYIGRKGVHLYGAYDANQAKIRGNGFLDAFNTVAAGDDSPLMNQLLASKVAAGLNGSQWLRAISDPNNTTYYDPGNPYSKYFSAGAVAGLAATAQGDGLPVSTNLGSTFFYSYPQFSGSFPSSPGGFTVLDSHDFSTYHALQTEVRRAFSNGFTFQASYVWSKSIDTRSFDPTFTTVGVQSSPFGASSTPFDLDNRKLNYAPSDFDRTHVFQSIWVYELPFGHDKRFGRTSSGLIDRLISGWQIGGFGIVESGRPTTVYSNSNDYTLSSIVRTVANCTSCSPHMFHIHRDADTGLLTYLTTDQINKFSTPGPGQFSNVGRNYFRLAGYRNLSMSLAKTTRIREGHELELRLEVQNVPNAVHYDEPGSNRYGNPDIGIVDPLIVVEDGRGLTSDPRKMQFSARYTF
jgi:hypothetical protein